MDNLIARVGAGWAFSEPTKAALVRLWRSNGWLWRLRAARQSSRSTGTGRRPRASEGLFSEVPPELR